MLEKSTPAGNKPKIAVIAHGHPDFSAGGAETAAYNLFQGYRQHPGVAEAHFLARIDRGKHTSGMVVPHGENEYLWDQAMHDWMFLRGVSREAGLRKFSEWLTYLRPDIIHAHHYAHLGLEIFRIMRNTLPDVRIFLTLHEYMAICLHNGQMIKRGSNKLCYTSSLDACHNCYPEHSREALWLRKRHIQNHFDLIDGFIAPSDFLRDRYIAWGLPQEKITVLENAQLERTAAPPRPVAEGEPCNRFGYFGQITEYKGLDILLEALLHANRESEVPLYLEVNGANLEGQPAEYREKIGRLRCALEDKGLLQWLGAYEPRDLSRRMATVDWVVVPSIWWENSPMVIQEAFSFGRPVICSAIGGMAEKVRDGVDGIHVEPGSVISMSSTLRAAARNKSIWTSLSKNTSERSRSHRDDITQYLMIMNL